MTPRRRRWTIRKAREGAVIGELIVDEKKYMENHVRGVIMNIDPRRATALELLAKAGIRRSNYEPPFLRLFWKFGFNVPPPHFASFWSNVVFMGSFFGVLWGVIVWMLVWSLEGETLGVVALAAVLAGTFIGLAMASYYAYGRRKHKLPSWQELGASSAENRDRH